MTYVAVELPGRLLVMTVEEFMDLPRPMYIGARLGLIVGEEALLERIKEETAAYA
jgi:hypothetical protein